MDTDKIYAERIASEYAPKDASKVVALRKLDARAKRPATVFGYAFGIVSSLLLGVGMCLSMGVLGDADSPALFALGVAVGVGRGVGRGVFGNVVERTRCNVVEYVGGRIGADVHAGFHVSMIANHVPCGFAVVEV